MVEYCKNTTSRDLKFSYYDPEFSENYYSAIDSAAQNLIEVVGDNVAILAQVSGSNFSVFDTPSLQLPNRSVIVEKVSNSSYNITVVRPYGLLDDQEVQYTAYLVAD